MEATHVEDDFLRGIEHRRAELRALSKDNKGVTMAKKAKASKKAAAKKQSKKAAPKKAAVKKVTLASFVVKMAKAKKTNEQIIKAVLADKRFTSNPTTAKNNVRWYRSRFNSGKLASADANSSSSVEWNGKSAKKGKAKK